MITCIEFDELAPELALGQLDGHERADALAHAASCARCQETVDGLAATVDVLVAFTPPAEPRAGFEERVLARIDRERRAGRRPRMLLLAAAAIVLGAVIAAGVFAMRTTSSSSDVHSFAMRTATGHVVGDAYLHSGDSTWVFVDVAGWTDRPATNDYALRVTTDDNQSILVPGDFSGGRGGWGTMLDVDAAKVRELALVDGSGHVWCSAAVPA